jgi:lipoprotein signal peptidase
MTTFVLAMLLVPVIDHALKAIVLAHVGDGTWSLGVLGRISIVHARIWLARLSRRLTPLALWVIWLAAAAGSAMICMMLPSLALGWGLGLLVGGALSHVGEMSVRGSICDYVCLRFWPAFNFADVAVTAGAVVVIVRVAVAANLL